MYLENWLIMEKNAISKTKPNDANAAMNHHAETPEEDSSKTIPVTTLNSIKLVV